MSVDTSLDWLAYHPVSTSIGLLALVLTVGSGWYYEATGGLYGGVGVTPENLLLAATVVLVFGAFLLGMYVQYRLGDETPSE